MRESVEVADQLLQPREIPSKDVANSLWGEPSGPPRVLYYAAKRLGVHSRPRSDGRGELAVVRRRHLAAQPQYRAKDGHDRAQAAGEQLHLLLLVAAGAQDPLPE